MTDFHLKGLLQSLHQIIPKMLILKIIVTGADHLGKVCFKSKNTESTNQIEELFSIESEHIDYREKFMVKIKIEGKILIFEVDSGAAVSIMSYSMFKNFFPTLQIKKTDLKLVTYCKKVLDVVGYSRVGCIYETETHILNLYIVNTDRKPILGREWIRQLNIKLQNINQISVMNTPENILQKYPIVLEKSMGKILNIQAHLKLKNNATPVFIRARKIPFALQSKVEEELLNLEKEGILVKVMRSEWATPIVPVVKANGKIRICGDFKITLNPNLIIDEYPLPSIENLFSTMAGGDKFTKLDLQQAYLQLEVHPDDQKFLTLSTPKGLFQCTRLMYGVASAPAIWQRLIENLLKDIPGVSVFLDDIKITAPDDNTHFERLEKVLCRLSDHNIRINYEKCEFMKDKIEYCGYVIDRSGIHKAKKKMDAIQNAKIPTNKTEVRAFTGLINYYGRFLENLSSKLYPIYNLLKEGVDFKWDIKCQRAFDTVKKEISSDRVLAHFDPQLTLILATDASPYAVGAVLSHVYPDGTERPIQFASQVLSTVQQKYSQIDKEAYSIIFGVKKFFYYLYGRRFTLYTDHKPLIQIFSPSKHLPTLSTTRMQHYALFLQTFQYDIKYKNSKEHSNADAMSRLPTNSKQINMYDESDAFEIYQIQNLPVTFEELRIESSKERSFSKLIKSLRLGKQVSKKDRFNVEQSEFSLQQGCLFRGQTVVIPQSLRPKILNELHSTHSGIIKTKQLARGYCWWPGISVDIENKIKNCSECNKFKNNPAKFPFHPWEKTSKPFERVHIDFAGPFMNRYFFILVDSYTRWPEIHVVKNMTVHTTIPLLRKIFSTFGLPAVLVSDNGPTFTSFEFKNFLRENGIFHKFSPPYHPATNGLAERYVQSFKGVLKTLGQNERDIELNLSKFLINYRKMPHTITGVSPSYLMFGRDIRTRIDLILPQKKYELNISKNTDFRVFREGERVMVREYLGFDKWQFGTVRKKLGSLIYLIELDDSRVWKRHVDQMRSMGEDTPLKISNTPSNTFIELPTILPSAKNNDNDYVAEKQNTLDGNVVQNKEIKPDGVPLKPEIPDDACTLRRSTRLRKAPSRLGIENCT
ncbi:uncharacterized protein K02A2.6-like [Harmonia axyridis]|uniref:uncharacterized protein K02A2.6-like n=1 Tax=Harmonia axyridis TaxID=115357 RepID=UPI001E279AB8|nr:uncharacterized protein K02A2.6-like [Harmonia axyridis]